MRADSLDIECLLDTGAELTCLPQRYETKLPIDGTVRPAYGAGADRIEIKQDKPIHLEFSPHELVTFIRVGPVAQLVLGMDILTQLNSSLHFDDGQVTWSIRTLQRQQLKDRPIRAKTKDDCPLLKMDAVTFTFPPL
ncbi:hypothetical protein chiPu_0017978 [Chiloscyllium punctatum]|uniref:Peptidase A2 domain-containing protein n=1 Tax=Chiloscyllium punctatum TaxID=137246 RepID=A0A401RK80_CHIPU|nr:hypothetical protein [Chiloscyllium punctatum]